MKTKNLIFQTPISVAGCAALMLLSPVAQAIVGNNLLTSSQQTTPWQSCDQAGIEIDDQDTFDAAHLENEGCAYRETPVVAGQAYTLTCGVSSFKYSSLTLAFLNDAGTTLATQTTEIQEDVQGGAYSVSLVAPSGATIGAVGIYGLEGSGFQDCTLLADIPNPPPEDGSIAGTAWFDENSDTNQDNSEQPIPLTPVSLVGPNGVVDTTETDSNGDYYFGGLDVGQCYSVVFGIADVTLTFTGAGGDNSIVSDGQTAQLCPTADMPNIVAVDAGFIAVPPPQPPEDYAICGTTFASVDGQVDGISNIDIMLMDTGTNEQVSVTSSDGGGFAFGSLPAGSYKLTFTLPGGYELADASASLSATGSIVADNGMTPVFNIPADGNSAADDACTLRFVNAIFNKTPVALEPTIANDDEVEGIVGDALTVRVLTNDMPCDGSVAEFDLIGHNVPGNVSYQEATGQLVISNTTEAGTFSIEYGLRGACGSYDTATVTVVIEEAPLPPPPQAPLAPENCRKALGKGTGLESSVHVDLLFGTRITSRDQFDPQYNFYDADMNLIYTGITSEAVEVSWGIYWRRHNHGDNLDVLGIRKVTAVVNGIESNPTECISVTQTPIALDTNRSGRVEKITGNFQFDFDGDGIKETFVDWFSPADGILIKSDFGQEITGEHLFGNANSTFENGFQKLATYDKDDNGVVTGKELEGLVIWTDSNSNAQVDADELSTLADHAIMSLPTEHYKYAARAILESGETMLVRDLWFALQPISQASR